MHHLVIAYNGKEYEKVWLYLFVSNGILVFFKKSLEKILLVSLDIKRIFEELKQISSFRSRAVFAFLYPVLSVE